MFYFLSAVIGFIIILLEEYILGAFIDFTLTGLLLVIIPVGCIGIGFILGYILHYGMLKGRLRYGKFLLITTIIISFMLYPAIKYMEYRTTYYEYDRTTDSYQYNRKFKGDSLKDLGISFLDYEKYTLDNKNSIITGKNHVTNELPTAGCINYIIYFVDWLSMAASCIILFCITAKESKYCENCRRYYKETNLFRFLPDEYTKIVEELPVNINRLKEYATEHNADVANYRDYYEVYHVYCPKCKVGELQIRHMVTKGNNVVEDTDNREVIFDLILSSIE